MHVLKTVEIGEVEEIIRKIEHSEDGGVKFARFQKWGEFNAIDVGTKKVEKKVPSKCCAPPKFEMLPTSMFNAVVGQVKVKSFHVQFTFVTQIQIPRDKIF